MTILRTPAELYAEWRDLERLPALMPHLDSVTLLVHRYLRPLLQQIESGRLDATFIVSHRWPLSRAAEAYRMFNDKRDDCTKVVLDPAA